MDLVPTWPDLALPEEKHVPRNRRLSVVAALAAVLLSGAVGCGQDDPTPAATGAGTPSRPASESTPTVSETPSVTPASGLELVEASSVVRVPAGWVKQEPILSYASAAREPGTSNSIQLVDSGDISGGAPLDVQAQSAIEMAPKGSHPRRLPNVSLDGVEAFHVHYTEDLQEWDVITTIRNGRNVGVDFILDKESPATTPDLIASVLATFRWTA